MTFKILNKNKEVATLKAELDTLKAQYATLSAQVAEFSKKPTETAKVEVLKEVETKATAETAKVVEVTEGAKVAIVIPDENTTVNGVIKLDGSAVTLAEVKPTFEALIAERDTFKAQADIYTKDLSALSKERDELKASLEKANIKYVALEQQKVEVKASEVNKAASEKLAAKAIPDGVIPSEPIKKTTKSSWIVPQH